MDNISWIDILVAWIMVLDLILVLLVALIVLTR
jgi:hypothetical protein